jgi:hypothetical protein
MHLRRYLRYIFTRLGAFSILPDFLVAQSALELQFTSAVRSI